MKRNIFRVLLSAVLLMCSMSVFANGTNIDGIYYVLDQNNKTAAVTYGNRPTPEYRLSIEIPREVLYKDTKYTVTSVTDYAFAYCPELITVILPSTITSIGMLAFGDCPSLRSITIPYGVTRVGVEAFRNCTRLESIVIPGNVTSIESGAFLGCSGLTSVSISEGVESIGAGAFSGCSSLTLITIPSSVTSIKSDLFQSCFNLTSLIVLATNPPTLDGDVDVELSFPVYVPNVQAYANWGGLTNFKDLDDYKPDALSEIYDTMQGETSSVYLKGLVQENVDVIKDSDNDDYAVINRHRIEAINKLKAVVSTYKDIKSAELGDLTTPQTGCAAVKVTKDDKEIILYAPDKVEYIITK